VGDPDSIQPRDDTGTGDPISALAGATLRLAAAACAGDQRVVERELLREIVDAGWARAAGIWSQVGPNAPWRQLRGYGGPVPSPGLTGAGATATTHELSPRRCLVVEGHLLNREENLEAIDVLAAAVALTGPGDDEAPPPLPCTDPG
jgi:hypothetical protein